MFLLFGPILYKKDYLKIQKKVVQTKVCTDKESKKRYYFTKGENATAIASKRPTMLGCDLKETKLDRKILRNNFSTVSGVRKKKRKHKNHVEMVFADGILLNRRRKGGATNNEHSG